MKTEGEIEEIWYHMDVNNALLNWTAAHEAHIKGSGLDLRTIPSAIGGNEKGRYETVSTKSGPAKKYGVSTGESLYEARRKCPESVILPLDYELHVECSGALIRFLRQYSPHVHQYSIDEAFCPMKGTMSPWGNLVVFAHQFREEIRNTLGPMVSVGVFGYRLLAKMASEFQKPGRMHTLSREEIWKKMWSLPIGDLFWVGRVTR